LGRQGARRNSDARFDKRRILDAAFAAHIRKRDHCEAIRGWPNIHHQNT